MDSTTTRLDGNNSNMTEDFAVSYSLDPVAYVFVPFFLLLGVFGNSLIIKVMRSSSFKSLSVSKMFIALALSDVVVNLLSPFNKPLVRRMIGVDIRALSSGGCKLFFWTYRFSKTTSSWIVVLIAVERFVAVWLPMRAKFINTERNVYISMALLYAIFAVFFGYWSSWADRVVGDSCIINSRPPGFERLSEVFLLCGLVLYSFAPSVFLVIFNGLIIYKLVIVRRKTMPGMHTVSSVASIEQMQSRSGGTAQSLNSRTTVMLLSAAIAFVVLVTPNAVANIVSYLRNEAIFETTDPLMVSLRETTQILEQLNHSINILLYLVYNKRFKDEATLIFKSERADGCCRKACI